MDKADCGSSEPTRVPQPGQAEQVAEQPPTMDVMGDANLGAVMLFLLVLGLLHQQMMDPCTC
eukprot:CAMPEP_0114346986 /NCGR_PEP_ID=MMETSP0101-20121206/13520_1 /TAXON_ID=38822 ORGANISM="Pteridomonas danica, Strain PT" /NCGR_SAMPLE_ID=MMETSP0101 /ASSEMBLY_ACC=CAM_ASM_000211 /LENGTH=61 /DNA_ID=CAMNT_0001483987 /DNA_START=65 /DNA_END=250 /DNA_ORIENTATION=-